jgi:hypothetical protein
MEKTHFKVTAKAEVCHSAGSDESKTMHRKRFVLMCTAFCNLIVFLVCIFMEESFSRSCIKQYTKKLSLMHEKCAQLMI